MTQLTASFVISFKVMFEVSDDRPILDEKSTRIYILDEYLFRESRLGLKMPTFLLFHVVLN